MTRIFLVMLDDRKRVVCVDMSSAVDQAPTTETSTALMSWLAIIVL
jgi:hypothetical protein